MQSSSKYFDNESVFISKPRSFFQITAQQFAKNRLALACLIYISLLILMVIFAPIITKYDPTEMDADVAKQPPSGQHFFGTDEGGRDTFSRVIYGGRISLRVGFISMALTVLVGLPIALMAGYYGGSFQFLILRLTDLLMTFPGILLALIVVAVLGRGVDQVMVAVGLANVPTFIRIVNSSVISVKENEYITAAKSLGANDIRILWSHILQNILAPIIVMLTLYTASGLLAASSLSFLGLGAQPPSPEWGALISSGRYGIRNEPWLIAFPGLAIASVVISFNILGDTLRDALDPYIRAR